MFGSRSLNCSENGSSKQCHICRTTRQYTLRDMFHGDAVQVPQQGSITRVFSSYRRNSAIRSKRVPPISRQNLDRPLCHPLPECLDELAHYVEGMFRTRSFLSEDRPALVFEYNLTDALLLFVAGCSTLMSTERNFSPSANTRTHWRVTRWLRSINRRRKAGAGNSNRR